MSDLVTFLRACLDEDEAWARAACQAYPYATDQSLPEGGVHWRWVTGDEWETVALDPAVEEFVAEPGQPCHLATVEVWPTDRHPMPRTYDTEIVEMDASAAGHIARWDPARVLAEVEAKRRILDRYEEAVTWYSENRSAPAGEVHGLWTAIKLLAVPYAADHAGFDESWRP